jgi:hypothetical protein
MSVVVSIAAEGPTDLSVARRLIDEVGATAIIELGGAGKGHLDKRMAGYNAAARFERWFVLRDLDHDEDCAPTLVRRILGEPSKRMCFRVAVRDVEAWLLADSEAAAHALRVSKAIIPRLPDNLPSGKKALVDIARRSRSRQVKLDVVPRDGSGRPVGPGYVGFIEAFAARSWSPERAAANSPSLSKARAALAGLVAG